ncbi:hypothetical protein SAMN05192534_10181 [Alteribacillus persepolensis]|uniref:Inhibitor of cysteine peptidase n=1 Tax=Alteribacillus persepolensis TaxID=568899 RepID=A0A1G7YCF9_9BACI|nr:hypothetical protein [Alteribacillus persepolensis]SDG94023.1 hypothetical protein SAMN05192534_10181 [Alteribacillus persepolensis]
MIKKVLFGLLFLMTLSFVPLISVQAFEVMDIDDNRAAPVMKMKGIQTDDWTLQYKLKGKNLYIECVIPDFSLAKKEKGGDGYVLVEMNGQAAAEMHQAAFIMKGLPPGKHSITIRPVPYDGTPTVETIDFDIEIQE